MFGKERKGINWPCLRHIKFKEPFRKAQNLTGTEASMHELKMFKAIAFWSVLKRKLEGYLGTKPASQSSLSENQECSVINLYCAAGVASGVNHFK